LLIQTSDLSSAAHFKGCLCCEPREVLLGKMVAEASLDSHKTSTEIRGSTSDDPAVQGPENTLETDDRNQDSNRSKVKHESNKTVPFYKLFSFADYWDCLLMLVGAISAVANGIVMPLMTILIGDAIDSFGGNADNKQEVVHQVSKVMPTSLSFKNQCCCEFFVATGQVDFVFLSKFCPIKFQLLISEILLYKKPVGI